MTTPDDVRTIPDGRLDEAASLAAYLDYHRETLLWKCAGLTDAQLTTAACPPSNLTLLGLVRHLTEVDGGWFGWFADEEPLVRYGSEEQPDADFEALDSVPVAQVMAAFQTQRERSRAIVAALPLTTSRTRGGGDVVSLRWVYLHLIEEYARHNGHADLLRQAIDGVVGE
jgi:Protein of unknown function (DUF664)